MININTKTRKNILLQLDSQTPAIVPKNPMKSNDAGIFQSRWWLLILAELAACGGGGGGGGGGGPTISRAPPSPVSATPVDDASYSLQVVDDPIEGADVYRDAGPDNRQAVDGAGDDGQTYLFRYDPPPTMGQAGGNAAPGAANDGAIGDKKLGTTKEDGITYDTRDLPVEVSKSDLQIYNYFAVLWDLPNTALAPPGPDPDALHPPANADNPAGVLGVWRFARGEPVASPFSHIIATYDILHQQNAASLPSMQEVLVSWFGVDTSITRKDLFNPDNFGVPPPANGEAVTNAQIISQVAVKLWAWMQTYAAQVDGNRADAVLPDDYHNDAVALIEAIRIGRFSLDDGPQWGANDDLPAFDNTRGQSTDPLSADQTAAQGSFAPTDWDQRDNAATFGTTVQRIDETGTPVGEPLKLRDRPQPNPANRDSDAAPDDPIVVELAGRYGKLTVNWDVDGAKWVWTYELAHEAELYKQLNPNQQVSESFQFETTDTQGGMKTHELTLHISGVNDTPPDVDAAAVPVEVAENTTAIPVDMTTVVSASEAGANLTFAVIAQDGVPAASINEDGSGLRLVTPLDFDRLSQADRSFQIQIQVTQSLAGHNTTADFMVPVTILNVNDTPPVINAPAVAIEVAENTTVIPVDMTTVVSASEAGANLTFAVIAQDGVPAARINEDGSGLRLATPLDFDRLSQADRSFQIQIQVTQSLAGHNTTADFMVPVTILNVNDTPPVINAPADPQPVDEHNSENLFIPLPLTSTNPENGELVFAVISHTLGSHKRVRYDNERQALIVEGGIDHDAAFQDRSGQIGEFTVVLGAAVTYRGVTLPSANNVDVNVRVRDIHDEPPVFDVTDPTLDDRDTIMAVTGAVSDGAVQHLEISVPEYVEQRDRDAVNAEFVRQLMQVKLVPDIPGALVTLRLVGPDAAAFGFVNTSGFANTNSDLRHLVSYPHNQNSSDYPEINFRFLPDADSSAYDRSTGFRIRVEAHTEHDSVTTSAALHIVVRLADANDNFPMVDWQGFKDADVQPGDDLENARYQAVEKGGVKNATAGQYAKGRIGIIDPDEDDTIAEVNNSDEWRAEVARIFQFQVESSSTAEHLGWMARNLDKPMLDDILRDNDVTIDGLTAAVLRDAGLHEVSGFFGTLFLFPWGDWIYLPDEAHIDSLNLTPQSEPLNDVFSVLIRDSNGQVQNPTNSDGVAGSWSLNIQISGAVDTKEFVATSRTAPLVEDEQARSAKLGTLRLGDPETDPALISPLTTATGNPRSLTATPIAEANRRWTDRDFVIVSQPDNLGGFTVAGIYGDLTISRLAGNWVWNYRLDFDREIDGALPVQSLAEDEVAQERFALSVNDKEGIRHTTHLDIAIVGVNDAPTVTAPAAENAGDLTRAVAQLVDGMQSTPPELQLPELQGRIIMHDVDNGAVLRVELVDGDGRFGTATVRQDGSWTYQANWEAIYAAIAAHNASNMRQKLVDDFVIEVRDEHNAIATATLSILVYDYPPLITGVEGNTYYRSATPESFAQYAIQLDQPEPGAMPPDPTLADPTPADPTPADGMSPGGMPDDPHTADPIDLPSLMPLHLRPWNQVSRLLIENIEDEPLIIETRAKDNKHISATDPGQTGTTVVRGGFGQLAMRPDGRFTYEATPDSISADKIASLYVAPQHDAFVIKLREKPSEMLGDNFGHIQESKPVEVKFLLPQLHAPVLRLTGLPPQQPAGGPPAVQRLDQPERFDVVSVVERQEAGAPIYRAILAYSVADEDAADRAFTPADYAQLFTFEVQWRDTGSAGSKSKWQALQPVVLDDGTPYLALTDPSWPFKIRLALAAAPDGVGAPLIYVAVNEDFDQINQLTTDQVLTNLRINLRVVDKHFLQSKSDKYSLHMTVQGQDDPVRLTHYFEHPPAESRTSRLEAPSPVVGSGLYHIIHKIELFGNDALHASNGILIRGYFLGHDPDQAHSNMVPILLSYDVSTHNSRSTHLEQLLLPEAIEGKYGSFVFTIPAKQLSTNGAQLLHWHYRPDVRFDFLNEGQFVTEELYVTVFERNAAGRMVGRRDDSIIKIVINGNNDPLRAYFGDDPAAQTTHIFVTPTMHTHYWHFGLTIDDPDHSWDVMRAAVAGGGFNGQAMADALAATYQIFVQNANDTEEDFIEWRSPQGGGQIRIDNVYLALRPFGYSLPDGGFKAGSFIQVIRLDGADPLAASQSYEMKIVNRHNPADVSYVTFTVHFAKDGNTHDLQLEQTGNGAGGGLCPPCRLTASLRTVSNTALITAAA